MSDREMTRKGAWLATGIIVTMMLIIMSGSHRALVMIDFHDSVDFVEGVDVLVDEELVGSLKPINGRLENGFRVGGGEHTVRLRGPGYESIPITLDLSGGQRVRLFADARSAQLSGEYRMQLVLTQ